MSQLLGKIEAKIATQQDEALFRLFNPVMKMYTAKESMLWMSEGMELFGGVGYMENSNIPVILRDCQVTPIWEGTTNVMSLDVLRALKSLGPAGLASIEEYMDQVITKAKSTFANIDQIIDLLKLQKKRVYSLVAGEKAQRAELYARALGFQLGRVFIGIILLEILALSKDSTELDFLKFWLDLESKSEEEIDYNLDTLKKYALDLNSEGKPKHSGNLACNGKIRAKI